MNESINKILNIRPSWGLISALFVTAVLVNYIWELLQSPLYADMQVNARMFGHCFLASLGDGVIVLFIFFINWLLFRRRDWFKSDVHWRLVVIVITGFFVSVAIEWVGANSLHRWSYNDLMPTLPGLGIGLIPVLQMVILPPIIFIAASKWWLPKKSLCENAQ